MSWRRGGISTEVAELPQAPNARLSRRRSFHPSAITARILSQGKGERDHLGRTRRRPADGTQSRCCSPLRDSVKPLAFPFIRLAFPRSQRARPKSKFVRARFAPTACPPAGASAE